MENHHVKVYSTCILTDKKKLKFKNVEIFINEFYLATFTARIVDIFWYILILQLIKL